MILGDRQWTGIQNKPISWLRRGEHLPPAGPIGRLLMRIRGQIERRFGTLVTLHPGLTPLPVRVGHLSRVGRWCRLKLASYTINRIEHQGLMTMMK